MVFLASESAIIIGGNKFNSTELLGVRHTLTATEYSESVSDRSSDCAPDSFLPLTIR